MELGLINSKISIPNVKSKLVERSNLFKKLDEGINYKLIIVNAPAGFGKSTLISSWVHFIIKNKYYVSWISLDEIDDNPFMFWKYMVYSIRKVTERGMENSFSTFKDLQSNDNFNNFILCNLLNDLLNLDKELFVVIDDLHLVKSEDIYSGLRLFIKNIPANVHVIVASRMMPDIGLAKLRAEGSLLEITQNDMFFSDEEINSFFKDVMNINISNNTLNYLYQQTEGWAAGVQMAALYLRGNKSEEELIDKFNGEHIYVLDYLVEEVFGGLEQEIQKFLIKTSFLDQMCSSLCNKILEIDNSQFILEKLDSLNLFIIPLDENRRWYRYHHLFKDFLKNRLEDLNEKKIYFAAAKWYEDNKFLHQAVNFYLKAEKWYEAKAIIEKIDMETMFNGEMKKVYEWYKLLPFNMIIENPRLCINSAWFTCTHGNEKGTEEHLRHAGNSIELLKDENLKNEYYAEIMVIRGMLASIDKDSNNILKNMEQAHRCSLKNDFLKATITLMDGIACIYKGEICKALGYFDESYRLSKEANNYYILVMANRSIIISMLLRGKLKEAEKQCGDILKYFQEKNLIDIPILGSIYNNLAEIYYEWNKLEAVKKCVEKAYAFSKKGEVSWIASVSYSILGRITQIDGDNTLAFEYMKKAEMESVKDKIFDVESELENIKANMFIRIGELKEVEKWLAQKNLDVLGMYNITYVNYYVTQARYYVSKNLLEDAESLINNLCRIFQERKVNKVLAETLILKSIVSYKRGLLDNSLKELINVFNLSSQEKYLRIFLNEGKTFFDILINLKSKLELNLKGESLKFFNTVMNEFNIQYKNDAYYKNLYKERSVSINCDILSDREMEVFNSIKEGLNNAQIAEKLFVSINTVKTHLLNIYTKLNVHSRTEALAKAKELNLL